MLKHLNKLLALLLTMSMVLSMVSGAFAVSPEIVSDEADSSAAVEAVDALDLEGEDVVTVDLDEEPAAPVEEEDETPAEEEAPVEEPAEEPKDVEEPAEEGEAAEEVEETPAEEGEVALIEVEGVIVEMRRYILNDVYTLTLNGQPASGYYDLPEMVVSDVIFHAGLYYFVDGAWDNNKNSKTTTTGTVNVVTAQENGVYQLDTIESLKLTVKKTPSPYSVDANGITHVVTNSSLFGGAEVVEKTDKNGKVTETHTYYYFRGALYKNGFMHYTGNNYLWYTDKNGEALTKYTGTMNDAKYADKPYINDYAAVDKTEINETTGLPYGEIFYVGGWHNGFYFADDGKAYQVSLGVVSATPYTGVIATNKWCAKGLGTKKEFKGDGLAYSKGVLYSGMWWNGKMYKATDGKLALYTGVLSDSKKAVDVSKPEKPVTSSKEFGGMRFEKGVPATGVFSDCYYYKNGKKQDLKKKWLDIKKGNIYLTYYFGSDGKAYTGWHKITRNSVKYKYLFRKADEKNPCAAVTDMFAYNSAYKTKKLQVQVNRSTDMATILAYDSDSKTYCIPCKSFVVAMSKDVANSKPGSYNLKKKGGWFKFKFEDGSYHYYLYPTYIWGSGSLFHSADYATEGNRESLMNYIYNQLGRNVTHQCVRTQVVNSKLMYNLVRNSKDGKNVKVVLTTSSSAKRYEPFGKMTLDYNFDFVGKLKAPKHSTRGFDPTDTAVKKDPSTLLA